jgi:hypothetical protein
MPQLQGGNNLEVMAMVEPVKTGRKESQRVKQRNALHP